MTKKKKETKQDSIELKIKPDSCWFCVFGDEPLKSSTRCKNCITSSKSAFKKVGDRVMKKREENYDG